MSGYADWMKTVEQRLTEQDRRIRTSAGRLNFSGPLPGGLNVPNMPQTLLYSYLSRINDVVVMEAQWRVTAGMGAVPFWMALPYPMRATSMDGPVVLGRVGARRSGVTYLTGNIVRRTADTVSFANDNYSLWTGTFPQAWASPDDFSVSLTYIAADQ